MINGQCWGGNCGDGAKGKGLNGQEAIGAGRNALVIGKWSLVIRAVARVIP